MPRTDKPFDQEKLFPATAMPDADWWQTLWPDPQSVLEALGIQAGMVAVDLCCGDGLFTAPISKLLGGKLYAIDLDPKMLESARQALLKFNAPDCFWIEGDARALLTLIPRKVDVVLIANTFHGIPDQAKMAKNAFDILSPNGRFIIINWHNLPREETTVLGKPRGPRNDMRMTPESVKNIVEPSGLILQKTVDLPPYHYGAIFQKP